MKSKNEVDLITILNGLKLDIQKSINCIQVGTIESFSTIEQTASVRISIKQVTDVSEKGVRTLKEHPILVTCPVIILRGGMSYMTFPITVGDSCLVFFNDRDIDNWFFDGGVDAPNTYRLHDMSDGFVLVGVSNMQELITDYLVGGTRWKLDATTMISMLTGAITSVATLFTHTGNMLITGGLVVLGLVTGSGGKLQIDDDLEVINGNDLKSIGGDVSDSSGSTPTMQDMRDLFNSHTHDSSSTPNQSM